MSKLKRQKQKQKHEQGQWKDVAVIEMDSTIDFSNG